MPDPEIVGDDELVKQYKQHFGINARYKPFVDKGAWICACGAINNIIEEVCHICCNRLSALLACDLDELTKEKNQRVAKEEAEREEKEAKEKAEQEARRNAERAAKEAKNNKTKRIISIVLPAFAVSIVIAVLLFIVILPAAKKSKAYNNAVTSVESRDYDTAISIFEDLGDYKDSAEQFINTLYLKALYLEENESFEEAASQFETIIDYLDSKEHFEYCNNKSEYEAARELMEAGNYKEALDEFSSLGDFEDSKDQLKEAQYQYAIWLQEKDDWNIASEQFNILSKSGYKDSSEQYKESQYQYGIQLINTGDYVAADDIFASLGGYKDSADKELEAMYAYVLANLNSEDVRTYGYLQNLTGIGYKDSVQVFNQLYTWKAVFTVVNYDGDDTLNNYSSVSKYYTWYVHFNLTGGIPNALTTLSYACYFPNGNVNQGIFNDGNPCFSGLNNWVNGWYDNPKYGESGTVKIIIYADGEPIGEKTFYITD